VPDNSRFLVMATDVSLKGGIGVYTWQFLRSLGGLRPHSECRIITLNLDESLVLLPQWKRSWVKNRYHYIWRTLASAFRERPHEIIVFHISLMPLAWLAGLISGAKLTLITHGWEVNPTMSTDRLHRVFGNFAHRMVAVSRRTALDVDRFLSHRVKRRFTDIFILPPTVDADRYVAEESDRRRFRSRLGFDEVDPVLLTVGRLDPSERYKGQNRIIRVLPMLLRDYPRLAYVIVGEGSDRQRLLRTACELGVEDRVRFLGFVDQLNECYSGCDLFVMPSTHEGFGIVYSEAMCCGMPVVAGGVDGSVSATLWGDVAFLCDPYDLSSVERAIRTALDRSGKADPRTDPERLRREVIGAFGPDAFRDRLERLLDS
jgi:glycosyltransferase involved in cell wall biosynthesis